MISAVLLIIITILRKQTLRRLVCATSLTASSATRRCLHDRRLRRRPFDQHLLDAPRVSPPSMPRVRSIYTNVAQILSRPHSRILPRIRLLPPQGERSRRTRPRYLQRERTKWRISPGLRHYACSAASAAGLLEHDTRSSNTSAARRVGKWRRDVRIEQSILGDTTFATSTCD